MASGPLNGYKIIELAGIGPAPFCAMLLADMGAEIIRVDRTIPADLGLPQPREFSVLERGRKRIAVDLKQADGVQTVLRLVGQADALIEGFRPGVTERIGLGPEDCWAHNERLVYGRMTGWGQDGPMATAAGHDINYIALAGVLNAFGPKDRRPLPPLNLVGDFGGGGIYLALGVVSALLEAQKSGKGQVVDAAMVDGAASLGAAIYGMYAAGTIVGERESNIVDGGAHFYGSYKTKDDKYVTIGSIEGKFYEELLEKTGLTHEDLPDPRERSNWDGYREKMAEVFETKTRDEWDQIMLGSDICYAPVLTFDEAPKHPHNAARGTFVEIDGVTQPGPAPRFSRTPSAVQSPPEDTGANTDEVLTAWGFSAEELDRLHDAKAIA